MLATSAPGASTWLSATALTPATTIDDASYCLAARLRLGLPPQDIMPQNCHSCRQYSPVSLSLVERNEWHYLSCMEGHGATSISARHHAVVQQIARHARLAGAVVVVEPPHLFTDNNKRPDILIILNHKNYLIDVTITHPTAPSNIKRAQKHLGQAIHAEKLKTNKYHELSKEQNCTFVPFVIETYGGIAPQAQTFLNELSVFAHDHLTICSRFDVVAGLRYAIACTVQRGNAMIASAGYANAIRVFGASI